MQILLMMHHQDFPLKWSTNLGHFGCLFCSTKIDFGRETPAFFWTALNSKMESKRFSACIIESFVNIYSSSFQSWIVTCLDEPFQNSKCMKVCASPKAWPFQGPKTTLHFEYLYYTRNWITLFT